MSGQNGSNTLYHIFVDPHAIKRNVENGANDPTVIIRVNDDPSTDRKFHSVDIVGPAVIRMYSEWPYVRLVTMFEVTGHTES